MARAVDIRFKRWQVRMSATALSSNNLGQVVHTHTDSQPKEAR